MSAVAFESEAIHEFHTLESQQVRNASCVHISTLFYVFKNIYIELHRSCAQEKSEVQRSLLSALDVLMAHKQKNYGQFDNVHTQSYVL